jgi:hypothetical protein
MGRLPDIPQVNCAGAFLRSWLDDRIATNQDSKNAPNQGHAQHEQVQVDSRSKGRGGRNPEW